MRIAVVQGTRPEIIKNYSIVKALTEAGFSFEVLHTGQHNLPSMCDSIYGEMGYIPDRTLGGGYRIGRAIDWLQTQYRRDGITQVLVNGDTAASIAGALAAIYMDIPVAHVEAGLRANDVHMLEERNRIMVDAIANQLFAYTEFEQKLLLASRDVRGSVHLEGNTTVDVLDDFRETIARPLQPGKYAYVTLHRKEFTDSARRMRSAFNALREIAERECTVLFSMHPRTRDAMRAHGLSRAALGDAVVLDPLRPLESLALQKHAAVVLTDSGCIQEEAYLLGVRCVTIRENTERQLTVHHGANVVSGFQAHAIVSATQAALAAGHSSWPAIYGEVGAGARIVRCVAGEQARSFPLDGVSYA